MDTGVMQQHPGLVIIFGVLVVIMLLLDLGIFSKNKKPVSSKEAAIWTAVWIGLSMLFSGVVYYVFNRDFGGHELAVEKFTQFQSAYWIEKALSIDNLFVFILVFSYFNVPRHLHHKVLFWGVLGALIFRAIFIFAGAWIINLTYLPAFNIGNASFILDPNDETQHSSWLDGEFFKINIILTLFGIFLIYAGIKSWLNAKSKNQEEQDFSDNAGAKLVNRLFRVSNEYDGDKFFTVKNGIRMATPLLTVIAVIEMTDLIFAVDSIPAIFAISRDPFILYTSNIFAILGLRSMYFLLANFIHMFSKLPYGLAFILAFIGFKMLIAPVVHIPSQYSLMIVAGVLILSVILSVIFPEEKDDQTAQIEDEHIS